MSFAPLPASTEKRFASANLNRASGLGHSEVPFSDAEEALRGGAVAHYVNRLTCFYHDLLDSIPKGSCALVVNHGGVVEMSTVACFPDADYKSFGGPVDYCEGVRLFRKKNEFVRAEILRIQ